MSSFDAANFKILIVDDDPLIRSFLEAFCEVNSYEAEFANNGFDALRLLEKNGEYGLVIVDFLMPQMHGIEFIKKARGKWRNLPIIAMSAWADVGNSFIEAGACLFLEKPFDPYVLEKEIEAIRNAGIDSLPGRI
jgi:DNA-binding response OmpR family regulator